MSSMLSMVSLSGTALDNASLASLHLRQRSVSAIALSTNPAA
jgi:hypothetical protein